MDGISRKLATIYSDDKDVQKPSEQLVQFGFPLPQGAFFSNQFNLASSDAVFPATIQTISRWPDQSLRWCRATGLIPSTTTEIWLNPSVTKAFASKTKLIEVSKGKLIIHCLNLDFEIPTDVFTSFSASNKSAEKQCDWLPLQLTLADGNEADLSLESCQHQEIHCDTGPLLAKVWLKGKAVDSCSKQKVANLCCELKFHYQSGKVEGSITIHNPKAAEHIGGTWDLGDKNSLLFKKLGLCWKMANVSSAECFDELSQELVASDAETLSVYQESSGGENWNSSNHLNRQQVVPQTFNGYQLTANRQTSQGKRIQPVVTASGESCSVSVSLCNFWQQFPSKLSLRDSTLELELFPLQFPDLHELQAGEKKTHQFVMTFATSSSESTRLITNKPQVVLDPEWLHQCQILPWFLPSVEAGAIQEIISEGLDGSANFLAKREQVDQYGWRHFGELYADHEAEGYEGEDIFVSHYNNQYDPVFGLYRQALIRGDSSLFLQASELARHVTDIDIYDTNLDKDEYNQGLFWHTDHYQKAETCSHRTYSKYHKSGIYMDHAGGGGPGGQHCYTTGLLMDYWLTGNEASKQAVLGLSNWITRLYEGKGTLVEFLLGWKNRYRQDLKSFGTGQYPLDRGIGNYINALLDSYYLTTKASYLKQVAQIIGDTVHPADDFATRDFANVEETWFYTVFFQAVARYLGVKLERNELDDDFIYARDCLSHYAHWMSEHEYLTLQQPEKLEFPNLTWTAQDLRKVNVLYLASYFDSANSSTFVTKAEQLHEEIVASLKSDDSRQNTRVMAILMQNQGVREWLQTAPAVTLPKRKNYQPSKRNQWYSKLSYVSGSLCRSFFNFSLRRELDQLRRRFPRLTQYIGPVRESD